MKLTTREKLAIIAEVLSETSAGGLFVLFLILMVLLWALFSGAAQIISSLPNWALAIGGSGAVAICVTALMIKELKMICVTLSAVALLAIQIGSGGALVSDHEPSNRPFNFPSFTEFVVAFSWLIVIGLAVGGVLATFMLVDHVRFIKGDKRVK